MQGSHHHNVESSGLVDQDTKSSLWFRTKTFSSRCIWSSPFLWRRPRLCASELAGCNDTLRRRMSLSIQWHYPCCLLWPWWLFHYPWPSLHHSNGNVWAWCNHTWPIRQGKRTVQNPHHLHQPFFEFLGAIRSTSLCSPWMQDHSTLTRVPLRAPPGC